MVEPRRPTWPKKRRGMLISAFAPEVEPHVTMRPPSARADHEHRLVGQETSSRVEHPPGGEEREREGAGLLPAEPVGLGEHVARIHMHQLARGAVRVLADDPEARAAHVLARQAPPA